MTYLADIKNPYDAMVAAAGEERAELLEQRKQIDARLGELDTFLKVASTLKTPFRDSPKFLLKESDKPPSTLKDTVIDTAARIISIEGHAPTVKIVEALEQNGIEIRGTANQYSSLPEKVMRVSTILSKAGIFKPDRVRGWSK